MNLEFCDLDQSHLAFIDDILMPAYQTPSSRAPDVRRYLSWSPRCWLLLSLDGQPAATGGCVMYEHFAYVGLIAVHPQFQRRGLGQVFVEHLMEETLKRGAQRFLLDASAMGAPLYHKLGYQTIGSVSMFELDTPLLTPLVSTPQIRRLQADDLPALERFDTPLFGTSRLQQLQGLLQEFPSRCFVSLSDDGRINGYIMAQSAVIGPWMAENEQVAEQLLLQVLHLPYETKARILMPQAHHQDLLQRAGFVYQRSLDHMSYGQDFPLRQLQACYSQLSLAAG
jgi:ribosomal protein S18 acetylase RimI-like enzyme